MLLISRGTIGQAGTHLLVHKPIMPSYNWEDFRSNQSDRLEVEWGERNLHGTRRSRIPGYFANKPGWLSATIVGTATLAAVGICAVVATTLVRSPFPERSPIKAHRRETRWRGQG